MKDVADKILSIPWLRRTLSLLGINEAVLYFITGKFFGFISAPLTLYLIATFFSPTVQGYYYTMSSLLALSIFFELGLGVVITQFASHEYANLRWGEEMQLEGEVESLSRFISLSRKTIKWYAIITALFLLVMAPLGIYFLGAKPESAGVNYILPWVLTVVFFALGTCTVPLSSALEGCGRVAHVQQMRVLQSVVRAVLVWVAIILGLKLYVISLEFFVTWAVFMLWLWFYYRGLFAQLLDRNFNLVSQVSWGKEVFPMQWRVAVSWIAAYFTGYLFVPLLFAFRGPIEAGQMGMTLRLSELVYLISMAWINTRLPYFGALVKGKEYAKLDRLTYKSTLQAIFVGGMISLGFVALVIFLRAYFPHYGSRVLSPLTLAILCFASLLSVVISSLGGYLRSHKQEPTMVIAVVLALLVAGASFVSANYYGANVMALSYCLILLFFGLPAWGYVFVTKRKVWHQETSQC